MSKTSADRQPQRGSAATEVRARMDTARDGAVASEILTEVRAVMATATEILVRIGDMDAAMRKSRDAEISELTSRLSVLESHMNVFNGKLDMHGTVNIVPPVINGAVGAVLVPTVARAAAVRATRAPRTAGRWSSVDRFFSDWFKEYREEVYGSKVYSEAEYAAWCEAHLNDVNGKAKNEVELQTMIAKQIWKTFSPAKKALVKTHKALHEVRIERESTDDVHHEEVAGASGVTEIATDDTADDTTDT